MTGSRKEDVNYQEMFGSQDRSYDGGNKETEASFGLEAFHIDERDKQKLALKLSNYDLLKLRDYLEECDKLAKIDVNKLARNADPLTGQIELPGPDERQEAIKILCMLMLGMRSLWHPVIRAIADHATMTSQGKTQGVGDKVAAAVGRQRVIDGLRLAEWIRKGFSRQDRGGFSLWLSQIRARQTVVHRPGFSVDEIIREILAILPDKSLPKPVRAVEAHDLYLNLVAGPVRVPANDNYRNATAASKAA